jgi:hypothetical protein
MFVLARLTDLNYPPTGSVRFAVSKHLFKFPAVDFAEI